MSVDDQSVVSPPLKDRSTGLAIFGGFQIFMGVCCGLLIPMLLVSVWFGPSTGATSVRMILPAVALLGISTIVTFSRISLMDFYREMNFPEEQLAMIEKSGMAESMPWIMGVGFALVVGYMLWVRRYFVAAAPAS